MDSISAVGLPVTYVNKERDHIVMLWRAKKLALGLFVSTTPNVTGLVTWISKANLKRIEDCPTKFYKTYKITDISPYESEWKYAEIDPNSIVFSEKPHFTPIPLAKSEIRNSIQAEIKVGSKWKNHKGIWVIRDSCIETLAGKNRQRVWIEKDKGGNGQAVYASSIIDGYKLISK